jgi:hypothetical protein
VTDVIYVYLMSNSIGALKIDIFHSYIQNLVEGMPWQDFYSIALSFGHCRVTKREHL